MDTGNDVFKVVFQNDWEVLNWPFLLFCQITLICNYDLANNFFDEGFWFSS